ncbi:MAG: restriction endonuclease subunit S [Anaerolineae bacterium]|nr:restriction endonuclease subunit S [Anaerolineae bacterium]
MADRVLTDNAPAIRTYEDLRTRLTDLSQWTSTPLTWFSSRWLHENTCRLDASYYANDVFSAQRLLRDCGLDVQQLQFLKVKAHHLTQSQPRSNFKRIYTTPEHGTPFLTTSQIYAFRPEPDKYLSPVMEKLTEMLVTAGMILISRSGTVARPVLVNQRLSQFAITDDAIRVQSGELLAGYLYAYLCSWIGQTLLSKSQYGVTVKHLESPHLLALLCPRLPPEDEQNIHNEIIRAYVLRDEANDLLDEADTLLHQELGLPRFDESLVPYLTAAPRENTGLPEMPHPQAFTVNATDLHERLDASYHVPIARTAIELLRKGKYAPIQLGKMVDNVFLPPRFKRIYVDQVYGVPFLQGSHLPQMQPYDFKYISREANEQQIEQCLIQPGWILLTRSGTIGRIGVVSSAQKEWAASEHMIRIVPNENKGHTGYIAAFLMTPYGQHQLTSKIHGAVVDELTTEDTESVWIPKAPADVQRAIGEKVVLAYEKKDAATALEEAAIHELEQTLETRAQGYAVDW